MIQNFAFFRRIKKSSKKELLTFTNEIKGYVQVYKILQKKFSSKVNVVNHLYDYFDTVIFFTYKKKKKSGEKNLLCKTRHNKTPFQILSILFMFLKLMHTHIKNRHICSYLKRFRLFFVFVVIWNFACVKSQMYCSFWWWCEGKAFNFLFKKLKNRI